MKSARSNCALFLGALAFAAGASGGGCSSSNTNPGGGSGASSGFSDSGSVPAASGSGAGSGNAGAGGSGGTSGGLDDASFASTGASGSSGGGGAGSGNAGSGSPPTSGSDDAGPALPEGGATSGLAEGPATGVDDASVAADVSATFAQRYEAEAVPPNVLVRSAVADHTCYGTRSTCPAGPLKDGANCCSGGGEVQQILGRVPCAPKDYQNCQKLGGGVEFHNVTVPADGTYDVTWWYHCGLNDFFGDTKCGGVHYAVGTSCRPHLIDVNGAPMSSTVAGQTASFYQFPCYPGAWSVLHAATTALPLKAGANVITLHAPHEITLDGVDVDALEVLAKGQGAPPLATPVLSGF